MKKIPISAIEVFKLAKLGCKGTEIADFFDCSYATVYRHYSKEMQAGWAELQISLRRQQLQCAEKGNAQMQIWLGKQILKQQDRTVFELSEIPDDVFAEEARRRLTNGSIQPEDVGDVPPKALEDITVEARHPGPDVPKAD